MGRRYRRARTDYPKGVLAVYDNGGKSVDRYTVVYEPYDLDGLLVFARVDMSGSPFHPQGVCQHSEGSIRRWGFYMGRVIAFEELPADCQQVVEHDLEEDHANPS